MRTVYVFRNIALELHTSFRGCGKGNTLSMNDFSMGGGEQWNDALISHTNRSHSLHFNYHSNTSHGLISFFHINSLEILRTPPLAAVASGLAWLLCPSFWVSLPGPAGYYLKKTWRWKFYKDVVVMRDVKGLNTRRWARQLCNICRERGDCMLHACLTIVGWWGELRRYKTG